MFNGIYMAYSPSPSAPHSPHIGGGDSAAGGIRASALVEQEKQFLVDLVSLYVVEYGNEGRTKTANVTGPDGAPVPGTTRGSGGGDRGGDYNGGSRGGDRGYGGVGYGGDGAGCGAGGGYGGGGGGRGGQYLVMKM